MRGQDLGRLLGMGTFKKIRSDLIAGRFVEILLQVLGLNQTFLILKIVARILLCYHDRNSER